MTRSVPVGEVRLLGDRAFLIGVVDAMAARVLARALKAGLAGVGAVDVVCGSATVAVALIDPDVELGPVRAAAERVLGDTAARGGAERDEAPGRLVTVPCAFDGPDLAEVAARAGCSPDEVVALFTVRPLTVSVVGFSPGFAYLEGIPGPLRQVRRRDRPRPVVPAGSVALANGHAAVYPTASPGGWQLVGRTGFTLFSAERPPYAVLAPGDQVKFTVAGAGDLVDPTPPREPSWSPPASARPVLLVVAPGLRAVVQDGGRRAVAAIGVPGAGPADPVSLALANRLVGNAESAGALELTGGGTKLRCEEAAHVAVVGASPEVRVDGAPVPAEQVVPLARGQLVEVGPFGRGCRTYVSVAGGLLGPAVFGSSASDELCGLGAGPLVPGRVLYAGRWAPPLGDHLSPGTASGVDAGEAPLELRVVAGPHPEWFEPDALARLGGVVFGVDSDSNRVGLRLRQEAEVALRRTAAEGELDSQAVVTGAVQLPPGGDPVILMPDHATLGGYPVVAVVASADHGLLGQCAPGTRVRLVPIGHAEAEGARQARRRAVEGAVVGHYPLSAG
jgi:KipI family sensor histidine kinase inhibitor